MGEMHSRGRVLTDSNEDGEYLCYKHHQRIAPTSGFLGHDTPQQTSYHGCHQHVDVLLQHALDHLLLFTIIAMCAARSSLAVQTATP
eukprot:1058274-Prorocentrum_minimum.AAC.1